LVNPWKVILATMVIYACGVITGAVLTGAMLRKARPAPSAVSMRARNPSEAVLQMQRVLDRQFDLSAGQREDIANILKASQERTKPLWDKIAPEMTDEVKKVHEEIRSVLTPEQWRKFMELMKRKRKAAGEATNAP
jgi:hypothetical protein